ncbi:hypothetical protein LPJ68_002428 [Coemansia sp. RSA 1086]|nr:hypothetical protein LPJ68_002428 [Coemansia sp. RSA 1086]
MITQAELLAVIQDIKDVAAAADLEPDHFSDSNDDDEQSENTFLPRTYDIDRLHADDARDKVFVAILKALAARHNKPSSPKELATCIMKHEFTLLGGATPYATVSSRISQHFKRIFEHSPPRPPILGRVAHEKHTRKYFYYVSSAHEQEEFQRKVRAGIIPTQPVLSTAASTSSSRRSKTTKKPRCMVPAIAVETDLAPTYSRRTRRAASADTTNSSIHTAMRMASRSASHSEADGHRISNSAGGRPRRTSYNGNEEETAESASDSDDNPYARKRFRSVRSVVAHTYPRRRRSQASSATVVDANAAPRARRSASHSDAGHRTTRQRNRSTSLHSASSSEAGEQANEWSDSSSNHDGGMSNYEGDSRPASRASSRQESHPQPAANAMLLPPVPNTTPRASHSPDQTPFPPAASPTGYFQDSDTTGGMQAASPLILPRSLMALPLDGGLFDAGSPPGKDAIPSPTDMSTPLVSAATALHSDDSVVPANSLVHVDAFQHLASATSGLKSSSAASELENSHQTTTPPATATEETATAESPSTSAADSTAHKDAGEIKPEPHELCSAPPSAATAVNTAGLTKSAGDSPIGGAASEESGFDFSFHELMDAELMSINELEKLWTNSNPAAAAAAAADMSRFGDMQMLEAIPEAAVEDGGDSSVNGLDAGGNNEHGEDGLSTRLAQKLLALSASGSNSDSTKQGTPVAAEAPMEIHSAPAPTVGGMEELDSVEPTRVLAENTDEHEGGSTGSGNKIILPDPFADIPATAMVATKMAVSPRIVLTIVETVPVYMTVITTTEPAAEGRGKWIVRRHRLLRLVENGYVNASSLLLAGGVASEQERSIVLSLEVGRFKWRRPQSKLYGTWIPLPRARALAATCSLNHRLGPFLNDNLESYFPAPLPTSFIRHLIMPFFPDQPVLLPADNADTTAREAGLGIEFQHLVNATVAGRGQTIARSSTFGATARGTPSPSIIQTLAARGASGFGGPSAKALFGADERQLNSLLQLLSAEGPMLGAAAMAGAVPENSPETAATAQPSPPEEKATETPQTPMSATGTELRRVTEVLAQSSLDSDAGSKSAAETQPATDRQPTPAPAAEAVGVGVGVGVDAQKLRTAISSLDRQGAADYDDEMECDPGDDLDTSMVIPSAHSDVDMISHSTPPSPPLPPASPQQQRFYRRLSRSSSVSSRAEREPATDSEHGDAEHEKAETRQYQSASGTFNARLAQTMEAFGFTGTAKTNLLLRLRAAAAAKSTGKQQAVAPYLLYRGNGGNGGNGVGLAGKRLLRAEEATAAEEGGGVRKRARVVRIARSKPLPKQAASSKARTKSKAAAPDASVVLRLASAIYSHTLNMAAQRSQQQQQQQTGTSRPESPAVARGPPPAAATARLPPAPPKRPPPPPQQQQTTPRPQLKQQQQRPPSPSPGGAARPPMRPPPLSGGGPLARPPATPGSSPGGMRRPPMRPPPGNPAAMRGPPRPLSRPPSSWRPASPSNGAMQPSPRPSGPPRPPPARPGQGTPVRRPPPANGQRPPINGRPVPRRPPPPPLVKPRGSPIPGAAPRPPTPSPAAAKEKPAEPRISPPTLRSRQSKSSG